jgi:hypothetical protein
MFVLAHLFCYAIGEEYVAKHLSGYALAKFDEALRAITPKDFAELVDVIASQEEVGGDSGHRRAFPQASDPQLRKPSQIRRCPRYSDRGYQSRTERGSAGNDGALRLKKFPFFRHQEVQTPSMAHYKDLFTKEYMDDWSYETNEWDTPVEKRVKSLKAIVWLPLCAPSSQTDNASIQSQWKRLHWPACSASRHATLEPRHFWSGFSLCLAKASITSTSGSSSNNNSRQPSSLFPPVL